MTVFFGKFQSSFLQQQSTETALVRVVNDIFMKADAGKFSVLVPLDLSAALDTVDHIIIIERLKTWVGISGTTLQWFPSYFSNRKFVVSVDGFTSSQALSMYGVLQGSIQGPILFSLYLLPLGHIIKQNISFYCYA